MRHTLHLRLRAVVPTLVGALTLAVATSCASSPGGGAAGGPGRRPVPAGGPRQGGERAVPNPNVFWAVGTRDHIDLWLHGFALLQGDTSKVPFFRRGYREEMTAVRRRANVTTSLDVNAEKLRSRFGANPNLVSAQFIPLYFASWDEVRRAANIFFGADGDPRQVSEPEAKRIVTTFAGYFPTAADRDWLRLFVLSLQDEWDKFYRGYWTQQQQERAATRAQVDTIWQRTYRPKLQRFLNNTQQESGDFILSLPLGGEGRTVTSSKRENTITVGFPARKDDAIEAIYVFVHEAVSKVVNTAVEDNTTPNEKRGGLVDHLTADGAVRGGALLLSRVAPDLLEGYMRYYLRVANAPATGSLDAAFAAAFPIPDALRDSIARQLDVVLAGI